MDNKGIEGGSIIELNSSGETNLPAKDTQYLEGECRISNILFLKVNIIKAILLTLLVAPHHHWPSIYHLVKVA